MVYLESVAQIFRLFAVQTQGHNGLHAFPERPGDPAIGF